MAVSRLNPRKIGELGSMFACPTVKQIEERECCSLRIPLGDKQLERLFSNFELILIGEFDSACRDDKDRIINFVLASRPSHPFWKDVLDDSSNIPTKPIETYLDVFDASGPLFPTEVFKKRQVTCEITRI